MATHDKKTEPKSGGRGRGRGLPLGGSGDAAGEQRDDVDARSAGEDPKLTDVEKTDLTGPGGPPGDGRGEGGKPSRGGPDGRGDESRGGPDDRGDESGGGLDESDDRRPEGRAEPEDRAEALDAVAAGQRAGSEERLGRAPVPAEGGPEGGAVDDPAGDGSVDNFVGSFWEAVEAGVIPKPELMKWNQFESWRAKEGRGPEGNRGRKEQRNESGLWRMVMKEYHGADWWERAYPRKKKTDAAAEEAALGQEVRKLYPEVPATSLGSGPLTAPQSSVVTRRLNELLVDLESYDKHFDRVARACEIGQRLYPETFTSDAVGVAKSKVNLMRNAYLMIADADGGTPPNRDHPDVGPILSELFMANFEQDYNPELFSPGVRGTVEAYDELLHFYEQPTANTLLEWLRESAEQVGVRAAPGRLSRPRAGPAAPSVAGGRDRPARTGRIPPGHSEAETVLSGSGGRLRPEEPAVFGGGAGVRAEGRAPGRAAGPGEVRDALGHGGRGALVRRDAGPGSCSQARRLRQALRTPRLGWGGPLGWAPPGA